MRARFAFLLLLSVAGCTRQEVGGALVATGVGAGYEGTGVTLGNHTAIGGSVAPRPEVGVPLLLGGLLSSGIGVSLLVMGEERAAPPHPPSEASPSRARPIVVRYPSIDPFRAEGPAPWRPSRAEAPSVAAPISP